MDVCAPQYIKNSTVGVKHFEITTFPISSPRRKYMLLAMERRNSGAVTMGMAAVKSVNEYKYIIYISS